MKSICVIFLKYEIAMFQSSQKVMEVAWRIPYDRFNEINIYI